MSYAKDYIQELIPEIKKKGFRVFIAERGTYGFFTDKEGTKIVSFQVSGLPLAFFGNYTTNNPKTTGTGWLITDSDTTGDYEAIFNTTPPQWAVGNSNWKYTTLKQQLDTYDKSSKYTEV